MSDYDEIPTSDRHIFYNSAYILLQTSLTKPEAIEPRYAYKMDVLMRGWVAFVTNEYPNAGVLLRISYMTLQVFIAPSNSLSSLADKFLSAMYLLVIELVREITHEKLVQLINLRAGPPVVHIELTKDSRMYQPFVYQILIKELDIMLYRKWKRFVHTNRNYILPFYDVHGESIVVDIGGVQEKLRSYKHDLITDMFHRDRHARLDQHDIIPYANLVRELGILFITENILYIRNFARKLHTIACSTS